MAETNEMETNYKYISRESEESINGKTFLVRFDLNVPMRNGRILDSTRIERSFKTINYLLSHENTKVIIVSHLGRPNGYDRELSLRPIYEEFSKHGCDIAFVEQNITKSSSASAVESALEKYRIVLLENLRFYEGEKLNELNFADSLAALADAYINDAFSVSHRKHASVYGIRGFFEIIYLGLGFEYEKSSLDKHFSASSFSTKKTIIVGGKKVSNKFQTIVQLSKKVDYIIIGGAMANTFLAAKGMNLGASYVETNILEDIRKFLQQDCHAQLILPIDFVTAKGLEHSKTQIKEVGSFEKDDIAFDLGPKSIENAKEILLSSDLLIWNGPLGYYEDKRFLNATLSLARFAGERTQAKLLKSIAGGGDIVAVLSKLEMLNNFSYISAAGGALLEYCVNSEDL